MNDQPQRPWSYSANELFNLCPERYRHVYELGEEEPSDNAAEFGKLVGAAIASWYKEGIVILPSTEEHPFLGYDDTYHAQMLKETLEVYAKQFEREREEVTFLGSEVRREVEIGGHPYKCFLDVLLRDKAGEVFILELKTSRYYKPSLPFDRQIVGQLAATPEAAYAVRRQIILEYDRSKKRRVPVAMVEPVIQRDERAITRWLFETTEEIGKRNSMRNLWDGSIDGDPRWPRYAPSACYAFGRVCPWVKECGG